jgi:hypothetical protein
MIVRNLVSVGFAATLIEVAVSQVAKADMIVLESNVDTIKVDEHKHDDWNPDLPPGGRVRVRLSSDETKLFTGPASSRAIDPYGGTRGERR